jgi:GDP/UDP-N,N'-diacetylbacillosamine 2-epimerase (hydrolysing)
MVKKICVVTGTRAEYGLLKGVIDGMQKSKKLDLQLVVTGMHLSPEFGLTAKSIEEDGYKISKKLEILLSSDTSVGVSKSIGLGVIGFAETFQELSPDLVLVLGDRFELLAAATAALIAKIPIGHIHGGELTEGAFDDAIRHSLTKMSYYHFAANKEYVNRIVQLGENPKRVFLVGGLGAENIKKTNLLDLKSLEKLLSFKFSKKNILVTFHPVTLDKNASSIQFNELLEALSRFEDVGIIFTMPNADTDGRYIFQQINSFCSNSKNRKAFVSLGQLKYLSVLKNVDMVIGNSSSGLLEAPSFKIPTINIGDRQKGRLQAKSVISCKTNSSHIFKAINKGFSESFRKKLKKSKNPYDYGLASDKILHHLENLVFPNDIKKKFFDLKINFKKNKM